MVDRYVLQRLAGEAADDYANSKWADPQSLKSYFSGVKELRLR